MNGACCHFHTYTFWLYNPDTHTCITTVEEAWRLTEKWKIFHMLCGKENAMDTLLMCPFFVFCVKSSFLEGGRAGVTCTPNPRTCCLTRPQFCLNMIFLALDTVDYLNVSVRRGPAIVRNLKKMWEHFLWHFFLVCVSRTFCVAHWWVRHMSHVTDV